MHVIDNTQLLLELLDEERKPIRTSTFQVLKRNKTNHIIAFAMGTYLNIENDSNDNKKDKGDDEANPLLFSGSTSVRDGHINLLVASLQMHICLLGVLLNRVHNHTLVYDQSLHVKEQLVHLQNGLFKSLDVVMTALNLAESPVGIAVAGALKNLCIQELH